MKRAIAALLCLICIAGAACSQSESAQPSGDDTVTISRNEFDELKSRVLKLEEELALLRSGEEPGTASTVTGESPGDVDSTAQPASEPAAQNGGRALALPDISLVVQAGGKLSTDAHDSDRDRLRLSEAELSVQGYVYPGVKADAFFTASPREDEPFQVEEAYLTYLNLARGVSLYLGKKHVPFGRSNLLHGHSWPYTRQVLAIRNLVAEESLIGEGIGASYLIPTNSNLFAQIDLGAWAGAEAGESSGLPDIVSGPGASFVDRFSTARLWAGYPLDDRNEIEVGTSYARGSAEAQAFGGDGRARLTGLDLSYRHFLADGQRILLRGETFRRRESSGSSAASADGYYLFGNFRPDRYCNVGVLYDWSEFPQQPDIHESALSLILTKQMSEQYYIRLQGTHGSRPNDRSYDELWLQWVWGVGPHTHSLE